jgi:hypothetical protein
VIEPVKTVTEKGAEGPDDHHDKDQQEGIGQDNGNSRRSNSPKKKQNYSREIDQIGKGYTP